MDVKGQGALEYLLLIGGAVLVAAIVIALISGMPSSLNAEDRTYCQSFFNFPSCGAASPTAGECCPLEADGATVATDQTSFDTCVWDSDAVAASGLC